MDYTPEMRAMLERQREYFASDQLIKDRAAIWIDATREECLAGVSQSCAEADFLMSRYAPEVLAKALQPDPLPDDTSQILIRLWQSRLR